MVSAAPPPLPRWAVAGVAALAALNLLGALGGALARVGALPATGFGPTGTAAVSLHGAVMMIGFFATLVALERAVALHRGLWVPVVLGLGGLAAWGPMWLGLALLLWVAGAGGLLGLYLLAGRSRAWSLPLVVEALAAALLLAGVLAFGRGAPDAARLGWTAFLVLTIAAERRELTRLLRLPAAARAGFVALVAALALAVVLAWAGALQPALGLWWLALLLLAVWLLAFDLAPRQRHVPGWPGHTAWCLTVGYAWLALAGALGLMGQAVAWHVVWLGFVFAMVFGHAPIMLPALAGLRPRPTRAALAALALMGASLAWRVAAAVWGDGAVPRGAALGHALAVGLFAAVMLHAVRAAQNEIQ
jgi:hypothetical protein